MEEKFNLCKNTCKALKNNEIYLGIEKCNKWIIFKTTNGCKKCNNSCRQGVKGSE
jgi:hypothetical protein